MSTAAARCRGLMRYMVAVEPCMVPREADMPGKITRIAVTYTVDTPDGPRHTFHGLPHMRRHIRPDRLSELIDDLTLICEQLTAPRPRASPRQRARQPA